MKFSYSSKNRFSKMLALVAAIGMIFSIVASALQPVNAAQSIAYELREFDIRTEVNKDHSYDVTQKVTVNLLSKRNSLEFTLPTGRFKVDNVTASCKNSVNISNNQNTITIIDKEALKKGVHTYVINYKIREYADRDELKDTFYYNALLPDWRVPIGKLSIKLKLPKDFDKKTVSIYAGQFGISEDSSIINVSDDSKDNEIVITGERIPQNYSVAFKADLDDGYWEGAISHGWIAAMIPGGLFIALIISLIFWFIGGRDPKVEKEEQTHPVEGILPVDIAYAFEGKMRAKDYTVLIVYLATKGYIRIEEYSPKKYRIYKVAEPKGEVKYIRNVFNAIFDDVYEGRPVEIEGVWARIRQIFKTVELDVAAGFTDKTMASCTMLAKVLRFISMILISLAAGSLPILADFYQYVEVNIWPGVVIFLLTFASLFLLCHKFERRYETNSKLFIKQTIFNSLVYFVTICAGVHYFVSVSHEFIPGIATVVIAVMAALICINITARGKGNAELTTKLLMLKKWIYQAEPMDVAPILLEEPNYYYDMLPYALVFDGLQTWAKTFENLDVEEPTWYDDISVGHAVSNNNRTFANTVVYAKDLKNFSRVMKDAYLKARRKYH